MRDMFPAGPYGTRAAQIGSGGIRSGRARCYRACAGQECYPGHKIAERRVQSSVWSCYAGVKVAPIRLRDLAAACVDRNRVVIGPVPGERSRREVKVAVLHTERPKDVLADVCLI